MAYPTVFPTSIDSYTLNTDGVDDVLAADVNELQSAIVAIETKLGTGQFHAATGDGATWGFKAGASLDVLWYRGAADTWRTPDSLIVDSNVGVGTPTPLSRIHILDGAGGEQLRFQRGTGIVRIVQPVDLDNLAIYNNDASVNILALYGATGNIGIGATTFGTSGTKVLGIKTGVEPSTSVADEVQLYSVDLSAGNATLGLRTETLVVTEAVVSDRTLSVRINGVTFKICLKA